MAGVFPLFKLPLELRDLIYSHYFEPSFATGCEEHGGYPGGKYSYDLDMLLVSKQVRAEAKDVWRREHVFVRIETPWEQAGELQSTIYTCLR
jgi:hypothetical protein